MTKIVVLDGFTLSQNDLSWEKLEALGEVDIYPRTAPDDFLARAKNADILVVNKYPLDKTTIAQLPKLKYICVSATGYNNTDVKAATERNIPVSNVVGYGSPSVAQHVFAMILHFTNGITQHHQSVQNGDWSRCPDFCYTLFPMIELQGKTIGIYGFGKIGQQVAVLAQAFGMRVLAHHKHPERDAREGVEFVSFDTMTEQSDFITFHAPLTKQNYEIASADFFDKMKKNAYLINTGRGALIHENDLRIALEIGEIAGAALDVLAIEPPVEDNVLFGVKNCIITPHQAWASRESRARLLHEVVNNVKAFLDGTPINVI